MKNWWRIGMVRVKRERRKRWRRRRLSHPHPIEAAQDQPHAPSVVRVISYDRDKFVDETIDDIGKLADYRGKLPVLWVDVAGIEDQALIQEIGKMFDIHRLVLEDVINA